MDGRCRGLIAVKDIRVEIDPVGPAKGAGNLVDGCLGERRIVVERRENPGKLALEVELPHEAIGERDAESAGAEMLHIGDTGERLHGDTLPKWIDSRQDGGLLRQCPVLEELFSVEKSPLFDETHRCLGRSPRMVDPSEIRIRASCSA